MSITSIGDFFTKFGCFIIGWNKDILDQCSEASHRQFRKLVSAMCIMIILWATISFCFADRYVNVESVFSKIAISFVFVVIVICIERIIILTVGRAWLMGIMRGVLALCMALLGATIFDQIIFRNDIQDEIQKKREIIISETISQRMSIYESDMNRINSEMDSLRSLIERQSNELQKKPKIKARNESVVTKTDNNQDGQDKTSKTTTTSTTEMLNPLAAQIEQNQEQYKIYLEQMEKLRQDKKDIAQAITKEVSERAPGMIEELEATYKVVTKSRIALVFYAILFVLLISLELFILAIRIFDTKCDYDSLTEHQLNLRTNTLSKVEEQLLSKK